MAELNFPAQVIQVNLPDDWIEQIVDRLRNDPEAEWVEVIRCKDCKHYEGGWYCSSWNNSPGFPMVTEEGYCNLAERREE